MSEFFCGKYKKFCRKRIQSSLPHLALLQGGKDPWDVLSHRSLAANWPQIVGLVSRKWPIKIRHPMLTGRYPRVTAKTQPISTHTHTYTLICVKTVYCAQKKCWSVAVNKALWLCMATHILQWRLGSCKTAPPIFCPRASYCDVLILVFNARRTPWCRWPCTTRFCGRAQCKFEICSGYTEDWVEFALYRIFTLHKDWV